MKVELVPLIKYHEAKFQAISMIAMRKIHGLSDLICSDTDFIIYFPHCILVKELKMKQDGIPHAILLCTWDNDTAD